MVTTGHIRLDGFRSNGHDRPDAACHRGERGRCRDPTRAPSIRTRLTPYLELDVPAAVDRYRRARRGAAGHRGALRGEGQPAPRAAGALVAAGCRLRRGQPRRGTGRLSAGAGAADLVYSNPVKRRDRHRRGGRAGRAAVRRGLAGRDRARSPRPRRAPRCCAGSSPRARARTGRCRASTAAPTHEAVEVLTPRRRARARRRRASPSTSAPSSATREAWAAPDRGRRPGLRRAAQARSAALAARPRRRLPGRATRAAARRSTAYGAAIERSPRDALRLASARATIIEPGRGDRRRRRARSSPRRGGGAPRRHPVGLPRRRGLHRTGRDPRRGDPLPARDRRRRSRPVRACSPGRRATAPTCSTRSSRSHLPLTLAEGDEVRLLSAGAYTTLLLHRRLQRLRAAADRAGRPRTGDLS